MRSHLLVWIMFSMIFSCWQGIYGQTNPSQFEVSAQTNVNDHLIEASMDGDIDIVSKLIKQGADVNYIKKYDMSPLLGASMNGHLEVVMLLIKKGADVNLSSIYKGAALNLASGNGHFEVVTFLIKKGAHVNFIPNGLSESALNSASRYGQIEVVKELIKHGSDVNLISFLGFSALGWASLNGHLDIVRELVLNGAEVNLYDKYRGSPLCCATYKGQLEIVRELIACGADVNLSDSEGNTALMESSRRGYLEIVKELIENGAIINFRNEEDSTAIMLAYQNGHSSIVNELYEKGAIANFGENSEDLSEAKIFPPDQTSKAIYYPPNLLNIYEYLVLENSDRFLEQQNTLFQYKIDELKFEEFLADGWNPYDAWMGMIGVIKFTKNSDHITFELGMCKANKTRAQNIIGLWDLAILTLVTDSSPEIKFDFPYMSKETIRYTANGNPYLDKSKDLTKYVCQLIFKDKVLVSIRHY